MNTARLLKTTLAAAICIASALAAFATRAEAADEVYGKKGPFTIHRIFDDNGFNRCAATLQPGKNMLRIAYTVDHLYSISVPGVRKSKSLTMDFNDMESFSFPAKTNGERTWAAWGDAAVNVLKNAQESINISVGGKDFSWNIGRTSMRQVLASVEDCVQQASSGAVQQDQSAADSMNGRTNGFSVKKVFFDGGAYVRGKGDKWTERGADGDVTFRFVEVDSSEDEVFLEDSSRGVKITLSLADNMVYYSDRKQKKRPLYPITDWK